MNYRYYLNNGNIAIAVTHKGERYKIYPRIKVDEKFWIKDRNRVSSKHKDADWINEDLEDWEGRITKALRKLEKPTQNELKAEIKRQVDGNPEAELFLTAWAEGFIEESTRATETIKKYITTRNKLLEYEKKFGRLRFKDITPAFGKKFTKMLSAYSTNYIGSLVKVVKVFMGEAEIDLQHGCKEYLKLKVISEAADSIYLTLGELEKLRDLRIDWEIVLKHFPNISDANLRKKLDSLNMVRDRFLIGAFTGLRVSDFKRLSELNLDGNFIRIEPMKGGKNLEVVIPIHPVVRSIIEKGIPSKISEQKINKHIKVLCRMAGITKDVEKSITRGERVEREIKEKCDLVTTHTARRSFATNAFKEGVPTLSIMQITGHTTEKSFLKYIKISREENAELLSNHPFFRG